jgi:hypothetical protein
LESEGASVIGVLTEDVRLYYDIISLLKDKGLEFRLLNFNEPVPHNVGVVLTSEVEMEKIDYEPKIAVKNIELGIRQARLALWGLDNSSTVTVGVDPGPQPGIAVLCGGRIIETLRAPSPERAAEIIIAVLDDYAFASATLKIGHGSPEHRDRVLAFVSNYFDKVEVIDESKTSKKSHTPHIDAAIAIARHRRGR